MMIDFWLTYNFFNLLRASKIPSGNFTSLFPRTLLTFKRTKKQLHIKTGCVYFTALGWWAKITKTIKLSVGKRKIIFFPAFYPDLPYHLNHIYHCHLKQILMQQRSAAFLKAFQSLHAEGPLQTPSSSFPVWDCVYWKLLPM